VIGGTGGLCMSIAHALMQNGAEIAIGDLYPERAQELENASAGMGRSYLGFKLNILDEADVDEAIGNAYRKMGRIDILVNAAGTNVLKKIEEYDAETWNLVMGVNITGIHLVTKAVGRFMIQQKHGNILSISSVRSILGMPEGYIAYCASKGALNAYTVQTACEWAKYGINCNVIAPTFTRTPINAFQLDDQAFYDKLVSRIPMNRICTVKDIAGAAVYLCSDAANYITGQVLVLDGGLTVAQ